MSIGIAVVLFGAAPNVVVAQNIEAPADISVPDLDGKYTLSEYVLLVRVDEGAIERDDNVLCGGRYVAEVVEHLKGPVEAGDSIEFLAGEGLSLGRHYLVFLSDYSNSPDEGLFYSGGHALPQACLSRIPAIRLTSSLTDVVGSLRTLATNGVPPLLEFEGLWKIPISIELQSATVDTDLAPIRVFRARTQDVLDHLRSL